MLTTKIFKRRALKRVQKYVPRQQ